MGLGKKFKKALKKVEKSVKKVAPAALTVVNPALGASWIAARKAIEAAKTRSGESDTSQDLTTIAGAGATQWTSPFGIADFQSKQPPVGDSERFNKWQNGGFGKSIGQLTKSPLVMVFIAGAVILGLFLFLRKLR